VSEHETVMEKNKYFDFKIKLGKYLNPSQYENVSKDSVERSSMLFVKWLSTSITLEQVNALSNQSQRSVLNFSAKPD